MWNLIWYGWHIGALGVEGVIPEDIFALVDEYLSPFVDIVYRRRYPPMFYYEVSGRVLFINRRLLGNHRLVGHVNKLFIIGRVVQYLSGDISAYLRRWMEILAKILFVSMPATWFLGRAWLAWDVFLLTVLLLLVSYFDIDGYIRALIMLSYTETVSDEVQKHLYTLRYYPFSILMVLRFPLDIYLVIGGRKKRG